MYSQSDIEDAVAGGALTAEQAASLRNHVAARNGTPTADEEPVRWLGGNSDVYVFYSSILLLVGLGWLGSKIEVGNPPSFFMALLVAAGAWGLAEYFSRRKRLPLSGITYAVVFSYGVYLTVMLLAVSVMGQSNSSDSMNAINAISALVGAGGAFLYWKRFNEPIAVSVGVTLVVIAIMSLLGSTMSPMMERSGEVAEIVLLILGLAIFAFAMWWDGKDPRRVTRSNDTAFWLHMNASWTVVIALCALLNLFEGPASVVMSVVTILLFVVLTLVALAVDRRTWVLAAALPLGVGLYWLINGQPRRFDEMDSYGSGYDSMGGGMGGGYGGGSYGNSQDSMMITLLILGILLVVIGMFWSQIRGKVVGMLPEGLRGRVPGTDVQPVREAQTFN